MYLATGEDRLPVEAAHFQLSQAVTMVVHIDRRDDGRRVVSEVLEVAGFDGHVQLNSIASYDYPTDSWVTANRFGAVNARLLGRAGFDVRRLAGGAR